MRFMDGKCCDSNKNNPVDDNQACCDEHAAGTGKEMQTKNGSCCNDKIEETSINNITETSQCCCNKTNEMEESVSRCCNNEKETNENTTAEESSGQQRNVIEMPTENQTAAKGKKAEYHINGMDCPSCALTIEKGLNGLDNIQEATVNYNTAKLQIVGSNALDLDPIENVVQQLGFSVELIEQNRHIRTYDVAGMDCGSCAKSIENHLNTLSAVNSAQVHFSTGKMK